MLNKTAHAGLAVFGTGRAFLLLSNPYFRVFGFRTVRPKRSFEYKHDKRAKDMPAQAAENSSHPPHHLIVCHKYGYIYACHYPFEAADSTS